LTSIVVDIIKKSEIILCIFHSNCGGVLLSITWPSDKTKMRIYRTRYDDDDRYIKRPTLVYTCTDPFFFFILF